jgi:hypothetical protein
LTSGNGDKSFAGTLYLPLEVDYLSCEGLGLCLPAIRSVAGGERGVAAEVLLRHGDTRLLAGSWTLVAWLAKIDGLLDLVDGNADKTKLRQKGKIRPEIGLLSRHLVWNLRGGDLFLSPPLTWVLQHKLV